MFTLKLSQLQVQVENLKIFPIKLSFAIIFYKNKIYIHTAHDYDLF